MQTRKTFGCNQKRAQRGGSALIVAVVSESASWFGDDPRKLRIHGDIGKVTRHLAYAGEFLAHVVCPAAGMERGRGRGRGRERGRGRGRWRWRRLREG
jgi:hypothetical protein